MAGNFGQLDILVNNAAFQRTYADIGDISTEEWDRTFRTNIYAPFFLARAAIAHMKHGRRDHDLREETMIDIRKHGFERDAQWREYLQEIEEAAPLVGVLKASDQDVLDDLAALRAEIASVRERIGIRRHGERMVRWQRVASVAAFLLLVAVVGRREKP